MAKQVTVIRANKKSALGTAKKQDKIRVAAYCRVSTDQEEQEKSFDNQVNYYTEYIKKKPEYELVDIYADEGISGTNTKKRDGFKRMIADCEAGKIDLVITKSISRFARNTQDCLTYSRKLKNMGIGIFFEKENINTLDSTGELLFTILSSLAQDESRNISENCKWGIRSKFQKGIPHINTNRFMGYDKTEEGRLVINKKEAVIVKRIFREFLEGWNPEDIARGLNEDGIPGVSGEPKWVRATIIGMLKNEKYAGSALLQKWYTEDFLTKKLKKNDGVIDQYFVEDSHPAIIPQEEWDAVQLEFERREVFCAEHHLKCYGYRADKNPFVCKIICKHCGHTYGRKAWENRDTAYWKCKTQGCKSENVKEAVIDKSYVIAWNYIVEHVDDHMEWWEGQMKSDNPLMRIRAKQMIDLVKEGTIKSAIPELVQMTLEEILVNDCNHFTVCFLDGTCKEVIV